MSDSDQKIPLPVIEPSTEGLKLAAALRDEIKSAIYDDAFSLDLNHLPLPPSRDIAHNVAVMHARAVDAILRELCGWRFEREAPAAHHSTPTPHPTIDRGNPKKPGHPTAK